MGPSAFSWHCAASGKTEASRSAERVRWICGAMRLPLEKRRSCRLRPAAGLFRCVVDAGWITQPVSGGAVVYGAGYKWPLLKGALRVEARQSNGSYAAVTREWLELGFARGLAVPKVDTETTSANSVHPNAILLFQLQADRNADGDLTDAGESTTTWGSAARLWTRPSIDGTRECHSSQFILRVGVSFFC